MKLFYGAGLEIPKRFLPKEEFEAIDGLVTYEFERLALIGVEIQLPNFFNLNIFDFEKEARLHHEKVLDAVQILLSSLSKKAQNGEEIPDLPEEVEFEWILIDEND